MKDCGKMKTRMEKYYEDETSNAPLRQHKNESLYENINNYEIKDYKLENNATVIDNNAQDIDVERIKRILDTRYNKEPKRQSITLEPPKEEEIPINLEETREYDINAILEKARSEKEVDYEKERLKKIRDTQYDILNSLDLSNNSKDEEENEPEKDKPNMPVKELTSKGSDDHELINLINTITMREQGTKPHDNVDPLDILTDLKGSDDTVVVGGMAEEESISETSPIMSLEEAELEAAKMKSIKEETSKVEPTKTLELPEEKVDEDKTASLTSTLAFTQSDFDDFNDLKKEVKSSRALIYVVIILVSLILIAGLVIFLNKFLNIGLF